MISPCALESHPFSCCFAVLTGVLLVEIVTYTVGDVVGE